MGKITTMGTTDTLEALLSPDNDPETKERYVKEAKFLAFHRHLISLGQDRGVTPNLAKGNTQISIPAFFALEGRQSNPINEAALGLIPRRSSERSYGGNDLVTIDDADLRLALHLPEDELEAARIGRAALLIVARQLSLVDPINTEVYDSMKKRSVYGYPWDEYADHLENVRMIVSGVSRDLDEAIVSDVSEIAARVEQNGYVDSLDYLVDVQQVISGRVDTIFSHEVPIEEVSSLQVWLPSFRI